MAKSFGISNAIAIKMCDDIADEIDIGGAGTLRIYQGIRPASVDTALSGELLLSEHLMSATAFGAAFDDTPGAKAVANDIGDDSSANNSGTAQYFRITNGGGTAVHDGNVSTSDADLILDTTSITAGQTVTIDSGEILVPEVSP